MTSLPACQVAWLHEPTRAWLRRYRRRGWVFLWAGVVLLVGAVVVANRMADRSEQLAATGTRAAGEVVAISRGSDLLGTAWIEVRFDVGEVEHRARINLSSDSPDYDVGDAVTVIYDAEDPSNVRTTAEENDSLWSEQVLVIAVFFGVVGTGVGVGVLRRSSRWRKVAAAGRWRSVAAEYRELPLGGSAQPLVRVRDGDRSVIRGFTGTVRWRVRAVRDQHELWVLGDVDSRFLVARPGGTDLFEARPPRTRRGRRRWRDTFETGAAPTDA